MLRVFIILSFINLAMFLDHGLDSGIMQTNIINKVLHNTEYVLVQLGKSYISWHTCCWYNRIPSGWRSILIWSVYFFLFWTWSWSIVFDLNFCWLWMRRQFTLERLLVKNLRLVVKKVDLPAWSARQWCLNQRSLGKFAQIYGFLRPIAHVGVHLWKHNINHLGQTCFCCVFVNLAGWRNVDWVLGFECFQKSSFVHFAVDCYYYCQQSFDYLQLDLIVTFMSAFTDRLDNSINQKSI